MTEPRKDHIPLVTSFGVGNVGHYKAVWPQLEVNAEVTQVSSHSNNKYLESYVEFYTGMEKRLDSEGNPTNLFDHSSLDLKNIPPTGSFIRSLKDSYDPDYPWLPMLKSLAAIVKRLYYQGSPVVRLGTKQEDAPRMPWLIDGLIQKNQPTMVYGKGSSGKSWLGVVIATLVHAGMSDDKSQMNVAEQMNVLYLDYETSQNEIEQRSQLVRAGLGIPEDAPSFFYKRCIRGLYEEIVDIARECREKDIGLVVVDSVGSAVGGEPENAKTVLDFFAALRSIGDSENTVTAFLIDHVNKDNILFGSVYKTNQSRQIFEISAKGSAGQTQIPFSLRHKKANNSPMGKPMGFSIEFLPGRVELKRDDSNATSGSASSQTMDEAIVASVLEGGCNPDELVKRVRERTQKNKTIEDLRSTISKFNAKERANPEGDVIREIIRHDDNIYRITETTVSETL